VEDQCCFSMHPTQSTAPPAMSQNQKSNEDRKAKHCDCPNHVSYKTCDLSSERSTSEENCWDFLLGSARADASLEKCSGLAQWWNRRTHGTSLPDPYLPFLRP